MPTYTFVFTEQEAQTILDALYEMAFRRSAPVIEKIRQQAANQVQPEAPVQEIPAPAAPEPEKPAKK